MAGHGSIKVIVGSLLANVGIAAIKLVAAGFTGSGSMLAEAIHSLADCTNQVLLLVGAREADKPPTPTHPLGRGRAAYFWSFMVALMIFLGGGVFSIYEGMHKLEHTEPIENVVIAYVVLIVALGIEGAAAVQCKRAIDVGRGDHPFWHYLRITKDMDLVVLFAENTAAVVGLVFALYALAMAGWTGDPVYDAYGSIAIGVLLCSVSVWLTRKVKSLLQGESADSEVERIFRAEAGKHEHIEAVIQILTLQQGPGQVMVAAKVRLAPGLTTDQVVQAINALEVRVKKEHPQVKWQFVEPDVVA
jgi:cation diffusion facilitator family transporter